MNKDIINWVKELYPTANISKIVDTPWSSVFKISLGNENFYLKQTPPKLFIETHIIEILNKNCNATNIPEIIATNSQLNCFIMSSCGDINLRQHFNNILNVEILIKVIEVYKKIQKTTINHIELFLKLNVPDWRIEQFPKLYEKLVHDADFLVSRGLSAKEISLLQSKISKIDKISRYLKNNYDISCLDHCDLNDKNMLLDLKTGEVSVIDFGETVITHPFFSLLTFLTKIIQKYNVHTDSTTYDCIEKACISGWFKSNKTTQETLKNITKLLPIYLILSDKRLIDTTSIAEIDKLPNIRNRIKEQFMHFLEIIDKD